ncbi:MAG TPA: fused MFS/spermidine synthase, partial [Moraxellaceae bacterium]
MNTNRHSLLYVLFALFALSGFSGLIYESIWSHYLKLFLGHAAYAQNLVLAIYMGGMAVGAWLASRWLARLQSPLLAYVVVEILLGLSGLFFHPLFVQATAFLLDVLLPGVDSAGASEVLRWLMAMLLILPQTLLLGATFPLMSAGVLRAFPALPGSSISLLYFSNSLGAVAGVLLSGFVLIGAVGLPGTLLSAALANFLLALAVTLVARRLVLQPPAAAAARASIAPYLRPLLLVALVTGLSSFIYEVAWIRMLVLVLGASTHAFELMLSAFILGLALGGLWIRHRIDRFEVPERALGIVQLLMGGCALATVLGYNSLFDFMQWIMSALQRNDAGYALFNLSSHVIALLVMLPTTFMAGMTLPLITYVLFSRGSGESAIGKVYAFNTLGAIAGVLLTVHLLMPFLGLKNTLMAGALIDVVLGVYLLARTRTAMRVQRLVIVLSLLVFLGVGLGSHFDIKRMVSGVYRHGVGTLPAVNMVFHRDGHTASIDVYDTLRASGLVRTISTNGKPDAAASLVARASVASDEPTMVLLGSLPYLFRPELRNAAVIGMGSGISANVLLAHPGIATVDVIEIEAAMVQGARYFGERSARVFSDRRSHIHIDDAKSYFSSHQSRYDAIVSEPSNPWVSGVSSLFTDEFYARISRHLTDEGLLVQWFHIYESNPDIVSSIMKAMSPHFSDYALYVANTSDIVVVAVKQGRLPAPRADALLHPAVAAEFARVGWSTVADVENLRIGEKRWLEAFFAQSRAPANSQYFPYVDQHAVAARFKEQSFEDLVALRESPLPLPGQYFSAPPQPSYAADPGYSELVSESLQAQQMLQAIAAAAPEQVQENARRAALGRLLAGSCGGEQGRKQW